MPKLDFRQHNYSILKSERSTASLRNSRLQAPKIDFDIHKRLVSNVKKKIQKYKSKMCRN